LTHATRRLILGAGLTIAAMLAAPALVSAAAPLPRFFTADTADPRYDAAALEAISGHVIVFGGRPIFNVQAVDLDRSQVVLIPQARERRTVWGTEEPDRFEVLAGEVVLLPRAEAVERFGEEALHKPADASPWPFQPRLSLVEGHLWEDQLWATRCTVLLDGAPPPHLVQTADAVGGWLDVIFREPPGEGDHRALIRFLRDGAGRPATGRLRGRVEVIPKPPKTRRT
jgi:hypothetical protein